jgi:redox-sensitive bicupin YhaK (pirin superfamily)
MPKQVEGLMWGFQLWVNLPARLKMTKPRYQDLTADRIPETRIAGAHVRVVAGEAGGVRGPVDGIAIEPLFLDVTLAPGGELRHAIPATHAAFAYVVEGSARVGGAATNVNASELAVLGPGDEIVAKSDAGARFLLLAGAPIGEPIARWGPFVMNTQAEIQKAIDDYRGGRLVEG